MDLGCTVIGLDDDNEIGFSTTVNYPFKAVVNFTPPKPVGKRQAAFDVPRIQPTYLHVTGLDAEDCHVNFTTEVLPADGSPVATLMPAVQSKSVNVRGIELECFDVKVWAENSLDFDHLALKLGIFIQDRYGKGVDITPSEARKAFNSC